MPFSSMWARNPAKSAGTRWKRRTHRIATAARISDARSQRAAVSSIFDVMRADYPAAWPGTRLPVPGSPTSCGEPHLQESADREDEDDEEHGDPRAVAGRALVREEREGRRPEERPQHGGRFAGEREEAEELRHALFRDEGDEPEPAGHLDAAEADAREDADDREGLRIAHEEREGEDQHPVAERHERRRADRHALAEEAVQEAAQDRHGRRDEKEPQNRPVVEAHGEAGVRRHLDLNRVDDVDVEEVRDEKPEERGRLGSERIVWRTSRNGGRRRTGDFLRRGESSPAGARGGSAALRLREAREEQKRDGRPEPQQRRGQVGVLAHPGVIHIRRNRRDGKASQIAEPRTGGSLARRSRKRRARHRTIPRSEPT